MVIRHWVLLLHLLASPVIAQGTAPLTAVDSNRVTRAAARAAMHAQLGSPPACLLGLAERLGTAAGRAFVDEARLTAPHLTRRNDPVTAVSVTLLALSGRDTVRALLLVSGNNGPQAATFWSNRVAYDFVRDPSPGGWHLTGRST